MIKQITIVTFLLGATIVATINLPSSIEKCQPGDAECLRKTIQTFIKMHPDGMPDIGIDSLDPLAFGNLLISQSANSPVSINLTMPTGRIEGWRDMIVTKVVGFEADPKMSKFELHVHVPRDVIAGKYTISGQILLLPIRGNGDLTFVFDDLEMVVQIKTKVERRNGEDYLKVKSTYCDINVKRMNMEFTNLFNDKALSDNMNSVINQNEKLLFPEIKRSFGIARGGILTKYFNKFFDQIPYRMLFAENKEK